MRDYAKVAGSFWTGETGRKLRGHPEAQLVALYLITCPNSNMIGLFHVPLALIAHHTGLTLEGARKGLEGARKAGFCFFDYESEEVFIQEMASFQIERSLQVNDNRVVGVVKEWQSHRKSSFYTHFHRRYQKDFHLPDIDENSRKRKAPSKPGTGTGTGTGTGLNTPLPPEASKEESQDFPEGLNTDAFLASWLEWKKHRAEIKKPLTPTSIKQQLNKLAALGEARAVCAINHSIANGWQGIFEPKDESDAKNKNAGRSSSASGANPLFGGDSMRYDPERDGGDDVVEPQAP